ncbi:MAG: hypothetical protein JNM39_13195 [Bdellovibrionaceae bacterium]|nr:hypothetical protein [Pseudobdellovibrionaceae bacterium]
MKSQIVFEILQRLKAQPSFMRRVWIFAIVGGLGLLASGAILLWVGVSAITYVASSASHVIQASANQGLIKNLENGFGGLPKLNAMNCWGKTQSLLAVQPWLEGSALDNLAKLKVACLEEKPTVCQDEECEKMKDRIDKGAIDRGSTKTEEGSFI